VANCQATCVYADSAVHWPVNTRLYLPRPSEGYAKAGVPQEVVFQTKPQIALALLDEARDSQIPHRAVVADCGYGGDDTFLSGLEERGEPYVVAVPCDFRVLVCENECPKAQREVIRGLPKGKWKTIRWREGHKGWHSSEVCCGAGLSYFGWPAAHFGLAHWRASLPKSGR